jgi:hypothetical protein
MKKYFFPVAVLIVIVFGVGLFLQKHVWKPAPAICSDDVRGYEEAVQSSLTASGKNLQEVAVKFGGSASKTYIDKLSELHPTDLLALKACDTQCKLLERCLNQNPKAAVAQACPKEYADYKSRVDAAIQLEQKIKEYEGATQTAVDKADTLSKAKQQLAEVQSGNGASGGREEVLKQHVAAAQEDLAAQVNAADALAKEIVGSP